MNIGLRAWLAVIGTVLVQPAVGRAFGPDGHRIVAQIAEERLGPAALAEVRKITKGRPLSELATWPDEVRSRPEWRHTAAWHFVSIDDAERFEDFPRNGRGDVLTALDDFEQQLGDSTTSADKRWQALAFYVHLVGDIHQPLHVGRRDDRGGNGIDVSWFGKTSNLHRVWDSGLIGHQHRTVEQYASRLKALDPALVRRWQSASHLDYAKESKQLRPLVYGFESRPNGGIPNLGSGYARIATPVVERRLQQAGIRLAGTLKRVLTQPEIALKSSSSAPRHPSAVSASTALTGPSAQAAPLQRCAASQAEPPGFGAALFLDKRGRGNADERHLPWGIPSRPPGRNNELALHHNRYVLNFDVDLGVGTWAAYRRPAHGPGHTYPPGGCLRPDPRVPRNGRATGPWSTARCDSAMNSGLELGRLVPSMVGHGQASGWSSTDLATNAVPISRQLHLGAWDELLGYERALAASAADIYVVTGTLFDRDHDGRRDPDAGASQLSSSCPLAIPTHLFKIIVRVSPRGPLQSLAFVFDNRSDASAESTTPERLVGALTSIDRIEAMSGVNFFRALPAAVAGPLERSTARQLWPPENAGASHSSNAPRPSP